MRRILFSLITYHLSLFTCLSQTVTNNYQPGLTSDGAIYYLPKTAIRITVQIEKTTYTPGDFCKYADRYLRLRDVPTEPSVTYRITSIRQEATSVADTNKRFAVKFDPKSVAANIALSDDGVLMAINATPKPTVLQQPFKPAPCPEPVNPRQYMSEEILAAGSTAKMAELTARDIYDIRESRNLLIRGQADNMPKDGAQLKLMLSQLEMQDRSLTSLFAGITQKDTIEKVITIAPDNETKQELLFRFSKKYGVVDYDDLAGVPYYIMIANLHTVPMAVVEGKKKNKQEPGIYVNIPGKMKSTIFNAEGTVSEEELPAAQFGNTELLSGALFNKRYATHLWLNPATGAVDRLEAEQPK
jgi:hypothetical protein